MPLSLVNLSAGSRKPLFQPFGLFNAQDNLAFIETLNPLIGVNQVPLLSHNAFVQWVTGAAHNLANAGFRTESGGVTVRLFGQVQSLGAFNLSPIFTLPAGYRPKNTVFVTTEANGAAIDLTIGTDGSVNPPASYPIGVTISFDGITFPIA